MEKILAVLLASLILLCGCAQILGGAANDAPGAVPPSENGSTFSLPQSGVSYTAHYMVIDASGQAEKTVWRRGGNMRVRIGTGAASVDVFFLGNRAYSCSEAQGGGSCFEITGNVERLKLDEVSPSAPQGRAPDETIDIGGTSGNCYVDAVLPAGTRKRCFTDRGVLAYDGFNATQTEAHVEYLTDITYSASDADFVLPAAVQQARG